MEQFIKDSTFAFSIRTQAVNTEKPKNIGEKVKNCG